MIDPKTYTKEDMKSLPKQAIARVRAIARGNNCRQKEVKIVAAKGNMHECLAYTNIDLIPSMEKVTKKGRHQLGEYIEDPAGIDKILNDMTAGALKNPESRKFLSDMIMKRADKGFGLQGETIEVDRLKKTYCTHEACHPCQGVGNTVCGQCNGQRKEPCNHCRTSGIVPCDFCNGVGTMQGPDGKPRQCNRCFGKRQTGCPTCQRAGHISCRKCKGSGTSTCNACNGAAFMTHVIDIAAKIKTTFSYDKDNIPLSAGIMIEKMGPKLVSREHVHVVSESIKRDDGGLAIQHITTFPFGDLRFMVKDTEYNVQIMGFKAKIFKVPHFLSDLLKVPLVCLEKAAKDVTQASNMLEESIKTRFFADSVYLTTQMSAKKAFMALMKKYPVGARKEYYKEAIMLSKKALANASQSARWMAYGIGAAINVVLFGAYFIGPLRDIVAQKFVPNSPIIIGADIICLLIGMGLTAFATLKISRRPIEHILAKIKTVKQTRKIKINLLPACGICISLFLLCALIATMAFKQDILWLPL